MHYEKPRTAGLFYCAIRTRMRKEYRDGAALVGVVKAPG